MANPNIVGVTAIYGKTDQIAVTTAAVSLLDNAAASGEIIKVNSLYIANIDGTAVAGVTVNIYSQDALGGTATAIASTVDVPSDATLIIIGKDAPIYLEEDMSIGGIATANGDLVAIISYEVIS